MNKVEEFRAGQRVRIRASAESEFAGNLGTVIYVGSKVCDVRIRYKPKGSKTTSTYIGTFAKRDLESLKRRLDLVHFAVGEDERTSQGFARGIAIAIVLAVLGGCILWKLG